MEIRFNDKSEILNKIKAEQEAEALKVYNEAVELDPVVKEEISNIGIIQANNLNIKTEVLSIMHSKNPDIGAATEILVEEISNRLRVYTWMVDGQEELWTYVKGKYVPGGEGRIKIILREILGDQFSSTFFNRVIEKIKSDSFIEQEEFLNRAYNHELEFCVENGIVTINPSTFNVELRPHTPEKIFLVKQPVIFDPEASCAEIEAFYNGTLSEDQKFARYEHNGTAMAGIVTKKVVILVGPPNSGKSTDLNLTEYFLGHENVSNMSLHQLVDDPYSASSLFGKIACLSADLSASEINDVSRFKTITGGDFLEANRKFKNHVKFKNKASFFFGCNELPRVGKADNAFWDRMSIFKYSKSHINQFEFDTLPDKDKPLYGIKDPELLRKLITPSELSGLLNKSIEGLIRYLKNGKFTYSSGLEETKNQWMRQSDSFMAFALDNIISGSLTDDYIVKRELHRRYHEYCKQFNVRPMGAKAIKEVLESQFGIYADSDEKRNVDGSGFERVYGGIRFKWQL